MARIGVLLLAVAVIGGTGWGWVDWNEQVDQATARRAGPESSPGASSGPEPSPVVLWVGDSYTDGLGASDADDGYVSTVCRRLGWECRVDAQGSTGFVANGQTLNASNSPLIQRLPTTVADYPNVDAVVIDAGRNDGDPTPAVRTAVTRYLDGLRDAYPSAALAMIVPFWVGDERAASREWADVAANAMATHDGQLVVDPVGEGWATRVRDKVSTDGLHPNNPGHKVIARSLADALVALTATNS